MLFCYYCFLGHFTLTVSTVAGKAGKPSLLQKFVFILYVHVTRYYNDNLAKQVKRVSNIGVCQIVIVVLVKMSLI